MPRRSRAGASSKEVRAPGGGTQYDIDRLARSTGLKSDDVLAMMTCQGEGVARSSRRSSAAGGSQQSQSQGSAAAAVDPAMMSIWGDFMSDVATGGDGGPSSQDAAPAEKGGKGGANDAAPSASQPQPVSLSAKPESTGPRSYALPVRPAIRLAGRSAGEAGPDAPAPGLLAQTGTLDATMPGRSKGISKDDLAHELQAPTLLFPSVFGGSKVAFVATSPTAAHSVAITDRGEAYGWGRNETGQLGLGHSSAAVPVPTPLSAAGADGEDVTFVGAAVGKYHTVLVGSDGHAYASGGNGCGQLGVNNQGIKQSDRFRRCVVAGDGDGDDGVRIVKAACGQEVSALLSSTGQLFTAGSSEFGQLGNGETGEYIIAAGRLGYANCAKFLRRSVFVQSESDRDGNLSTSTEAATSKTVTLPDSFDICLSDISGGKHHFVAVEAPSSDPSHVPRVFTWGCGDYGCLGHGVQADEYSPRMVAGFRGPVFASNHPASTSVGSNCTLVLTRNGQVYYSGKHKNNSEATMRPAVIDALANNGHVVTSVGAGNQTVFCCTRSGVTVSWGHGSLGELGYGAGDKKSSAAPNFVNALDSCLVTSVSCGMGHTLFIIRNDDGEDAKALKKVATVEESDVAGFIEEMNEKKVEGGGPPKKKQKQGGRK